MDKFGKSIDNSNSMKRFIVELPFTTTIDGSIDLGNKRICGILDPVKANDVSSMNFVKESIRNLSDELKEDISILSQGFTQHIVQIDLQLRKLQTIQSDLETHIGLLEKKVDKINTSQ